MTVLVIAVGAALGAPCRYLLDRAVQARHAQRFPYGTLLINLLGSGVLGVLIGLSSAGRLSSVALAGAGTGWCGAFTTYSTFGYETLQLARDGYRSRAIGYVVLSVGGGLGLASAGVLIGRG
jgi:CrcB protein